MPGHESAALASYPSRTRQRLETRDRIFEAALAEFRRAGVAGAEIERIVRAAAVARGTFYLHFPTKDHVLMELLRRRQAVLAERLRTARVPSARAFLRRAVDLMADDAIGEDSALWHELFAVIARHAPEMRSEASALVETLTAFFAAAQARGEVRRDVTPFDLTAVFLPGVYGLLQMKLDDPRAEVRSALHRVVDIFVRGIRRREWRAR
ncbi:MAG TPA: TetR/AcrR family transcriptional regulator [Candidatus Binatia bacterium]|nr:TetR/AcrR family transcriptional regulator [Candidatus Binatia bacterium]